MASNVLSKSQVDFFNEQGYLLVENLLTQKEVEEYRNVYEDFLSTKLNQPLTGQTLQGNPMIQLKNLKVKG